MSIAQLKKVTVCGLLKEKRLLLEGLQRLGCMHLLPLRPAPAEIEKVATPRAEEAYKALRFLTDVREKRKQVRRDPAFDVDAVIARIMDTKDRLREVGDRRDFLAHRIAALEPWGDLVFPPNEELAGYYLWFYILPVNKLAALEEIEPPWQIVHRDHRLAYVVVIAQDEPPGDLLPVQRTHTGALPLSELKAQLEDIEVELENIIAERQALTRFIYLLSANLAEAENHAALIYADQQVHEDDHVVAVQGWVPRESVPDLLAYAEERGLACLVEEPRYDESPPTLLVNSPEMAGGAGLAMFYQVPNYRSWDPSAALFFSFSIFFAMIIADAGYGLLLMGGLLVFWKRLGQSAGGYGLRTICLSLFGCAIAYGVMVGSYFGVAPGEGSFLSWFKVLDVSDYGLMMRISILIGVFHLVLANGIVAYMNWGRSLAYAKLGWIAGLFGGFFATFGEPEAFVTDIGYLLIALGLVAIFLFSSERPVTGKPSDILWRALDGFRSLAGVMGMFGDVLSYMRLFALGLASASLAVTFNDLALQVRDGAPGVGLLLAILLLIVGHSMNFGLSIMSAVIHGLRLNFMEFYKWGMAEEGKPFQEFSRKEAQL